MESKISVMMCDICLSKYPLVFSDVDENQGYGCCSIVTEKWVRCSYGSIYDDQIFIWEGGLCPKQYLNHKNICDICIDHLMTKNVLTRKLSEQRLVRNE